MRSARGDLMLNRLNLSLRGVLWRQFKEFWWVYLLAMGAMFLTHCFQVELPFIAQRLGEMVLDSRVGEIPYAKYFLIALAIIFFRTASRILFFWPARVLQGNLQEELTMRIEQSPPWRYRSYSPGQIYQHLVIDLMNVRAFVGFGVLQVGNILVAVTVLLPRLADFNHHLLMAFIPLVVCTLILFLATSFTQKFYREMTDIQGDVQNFIIETYEGKKTIKNFQAERSFLYLFERECRRELRAFFKADLGPTLSAPLTILGVGLTFLWGANIIYEEKLGNTALILFSGFVFLLQGPLIFTAWIGVVSSRTLGSWQRIKKLLENLERKSPEEVAIEQLNKEEEHFNLNLWGQKSSFPFRRHRWNVIAGETGAGKSTLLEYYATLLKSQGKSISYVAQAPYLYNDTIQSNIFLGKKPRSAGN